MTHICIAKLTNIGSDNGLSPGRRQAIIRTNAGILFIGPLGTNFSELFFVIHTFSLNKMHLKLSSAKWRPFCLGLNVFTLCVLYSSAKRSCRKRKICQKLCSWSVKGPWPRRTRSRWRLPSSLRMISCNRTVTHHMTGR